MTSIKWETWLKGGWNYLIVVIWFVRRTISCWGLIVCNSIYRKSGSRGGASQLFISWILLLQNFLCQQYSINALIIISPIQPVLDIYGCVNDSQKIWYLFWICMHEHHKPKLTISNALTLLNYIVSLLLLFHIISIWCSIS